MDGVLLRLYKAILSLRVKPALKFKIVKRIRGSIQKFKAFCGLSVRDVCLVMSNEGYGHEYWIKQYSGYKGDVYAQIEHGVYFGQNTSPKVNPVEAEHEFGAFITYGQYREDCIKQSDPQANVVAIGPYIQYASTDEGYKREILGKIDPLGKTIVLFPAHSVKDGRAIFDHLNLISEVTKIAERLGITNRLVCLSPMDYEGELVREYESEGFVVVTCGSDARSFLPRQRAIFEVADISVSNDLGTHVGYSLSMKVPHRFVCMIPFSAKVVAPGANMRSIKEERELFESAFSDLDYGCGITDEQIALVDYYWGANIHYSPDELARKLKELEARYREKEASWVRR